MEPNWDVEMTLGRQGEATFALGQPEFFLDGSKLVRIPVRVTATGLSAETWIELEPWGPWIPGFIGYLDDLDRSWRGWSGVKEWKDDWDVTLSASHQSTLVATLTISMEHLEGPGDHGAWTTEVDVPFEPAAVATFAKLVRAELSRAPWDVPGLPQEG